MTFMHVTKARHLNLADLGCLFQDWEDELCRDADSQIHHQQRRAICPDGDKVRTLSDEDRKFFPKVLPRGNSMHIEDHAAP